MERFLLAMAVLSNLWLVFYLIKEDRTLAGRQRGDDEDYGNSPLPDIMGKSLFRMRRKEVQEDIRLPQAATSSESEAVDVKEVTFADGNAEEHPARIPDERMEEVFKDTRMEDVPAEYPENEDGTPEPRADGISFDEIAKAVDTVDNPDAGNEECREAGRVFHEMEGNGFYEAYMRNHKDCEERIHGLVSAYLEMLSIPELKPKRGRKPGKRSKNVLQVPDDIADFDIRNYV